MNQFLAAFIFKFPITFLSLWNKYKLKNVYIYYVYTFPNRGITCPMKVLGMTFVYKTLFEKGKKIHNKTIKMFILLLWN